MTLNIQPQEEEAACTNSSVHPSSLEGLIKLRQAGLIRHPVDEVSQHQCCAWGSVVRFNDNGEMIFLDLAGCRLRKGLPDGVLEIFENYFKTSLKRLNLGNTDLPVNEMLPLLEILSSSLEGLYLGGNYLCDAGAERIGEWIPKAVNLQILDLRYTNIGPSGCAGLVAGLRGNCKIKKLYLEGNQVKDDGVKEIAHWLSNVIENSSSTSTPTLQELFLGSNQIGSDGAKALATCLRSNKTVSKIYIEGNNIGVIGAEAFTNVLLECQGDTSLKYLFCDNNNIGKHASKRLANALNSATAIGDSLLEQS